MIRRPPRSTQSRSSAASDVYKRQLMGGAVQSHTSAGAGNISNLSNISMITNESGGAQQPNRLYNFQVPVMLNPGEVIAANNSDPGRNAPDNGNYGVFIHAILTPGPSANPPNVQSAQNGFSNVSEPTQSEPESLARELPGRMSEDSILAEPVQQERGRTIVESFPQVIQEVEDRHDDQQVNHTNYRSQSNPNLPSNHHTEDRNFGNPPPSGSSNYNESRNISDCSRNIF
eukprot:TRINITY_DN641_c0_g3_i1.p1 TRINITY_DN641_c0_g3~~TRINITY_DN641_c0_g3_i1.p1  ORF type:complete len:230 (+),score=50.29 TRINITY_DN641_c0_g3_i1:68-757(+)